MWTLNHTLLEIALRAAIIYFVMLLGLRLTGKREVGQMTPFELVLLLLIANAVQNAMTGPDTSLAGGLVAAATLLAMNTLVTRVAWRMPDGAPPGRGHAHTADSQRKGPAGAPDQGADFRGGPATGLARARRRPDGGR